MCYDEIRKKLAVFMIYFLFIMTGRFRSTLSVQFRCSSRIKKEDLSTCKALGMTKSKNHFRIQNQKDLLSQWPAQSIGLVFGTLICLLQEKYGLIALGDGSSIITAYPVKIVFEDILLIRSLPSYRSAIQPPISPVKYLVNKLAK